MVIKGIKNENILLRRMKESWLEVLVLLALSCDSERDIDVMKGWPLNKYRHPHIFIAFTTDLKNVLTFFFFLALSTFDQE